MKKYFDPKTIQDMKSITPPWGRINGSPYSLWARFINTIRLTLNDISDQIDTLSESLDIDRLNPHLPYIAFKYDNTISIPFQESSSEDEFLFFLPDQLSADYEFNEINSSKTPFQLTIIDKYLYLILKDGYKYDIYELVQDDFTRNLSITRQKTIYDQVNVVIELEPGKNAIPLPYKYVDSVTIGEVIEVDPELYDDIYDFNNNGVIDYDDYEYFVNNYYNKTTNLESVKFDVGNDGFIGDDDLIQLTKRIGANVDTSHVLIYENTGANPIETIVTYRNIDPICGISSYDYVERSENNDKILNYERLSVQFKIRNGVIYYNIPEKPIVYTLENPIIDATIKDDYLFLLYNDRIKLATFLAVSSFIFAFRTSPLP